MLIEINKQIISTAWGKFFISVYISGHFSRLTIYVLYACLIQSKLRSQSDQTASTISKIGEKTRAKQRFSNEQAGSLSDCMIVTVHK